MKQIERDSQGVPTNGHDIGGAPKLFNWALPTLFLVGRLILLPALPLEGLRGFGDLAHFYNLAQMGWPYLEYWVEFPPIFPLISRVLFLAAGSHQHVYDYLLVFILSIAQAGSLYIFLRLAEGIHPLAEYSLRGWIYLIILMALSYGWWYFDPMVEVMMLSGIYWILKGRDRLGGLILGVGILTKLFPVLALPLAWRFRPWKRALLITSLALGVAIAGYGGLYLLSPRNTVASILSQMSKGSWETVWALVDGNYNTGNLGPLIERYNPEAADQPRGNLARLPAYITIMPFLVLGGWLFWRARVTNALLALSFQGITWSIFLLWSPGWSPQWVLYLLPLILLTLPLLEAGLMAVLLVCVNLLEWPVMLSRGYVWGLWMTIPIRTGLLILLAMLWYAQLFRKRTHSSPVSPSLENAG